MENRMNGEGQAEEKSGDLLFDDLPPTPSKPDPPRVEVREEGGDLIGGEVRAEIRENTEKERRGETEDPDETEDPGETASKDLDLATDPNTHPAAPKTSFSSKFKKGVKKVAKGATTKSKDRGGRTGPKARGKTSAKSPPAKSPATGASGPRKVASMATHKKGSEANGDAKMVGMNVSEDVAKNVRRFQAKMQLETGDKTSYSDAIGTAVEIALAAN